MSPFEELVQRCLRAGFTAQSLQFHLKRAVIMSLLRKHYGNQCHTAAELGVHRNTLSRMCDALKIDVRKIRKGAYYAQPNI